MSTSAHDPAVVRMRADQDAGVSRSAACAAVRAAPRPSAHERHLALGLRDEHRRAGEQDEALGVRQPHARGRTPRGCAPAAARTTCRRAARPVTITRSAGMPCSSTASRFCASFHTSTASGCTRSRPLLVRLSQLAMRGPTRMPQRARGLDPRPPDRRPTVHQRRHQQRRPGGCSRRNCRDRRVARGSPRSSACRAADQARGRCRRRTCPAGRSHPAQRTPRQHLALHALRAARAPRRSAGAGSGRSPSAPRTRRPPSASRSRCAAARRPARSRGRRRPAAPRAATGFFARWLVDARCATAWPRAASSSMAES